MMAQGRVKHCFSFKHASMVDIVDDYTGLSALEKEAC